VRDWTGHTPEQLAHMRAFVEQLRQQGIDAIED
jgi:hypothetical protein